MSEQADYTFAELVSIVGDEAIESVLSSQHELNFTTPSRDAWQVGVQDAVNKMLHEERVTGQDVNLAQVAAKEVLFKAVLHARSSGRAEIFSSDISTALELKIWPFS